MRGLVVRERRASDSAAVRRVARAAWRATYEGRVPSAFIGVVLRRFYHRGRLVEGLLDRRRDCYVAEDGTVVGYADLLEEPAGRVEMTRIYVRPDRQGVGVGSALLRACVRAARKRRAPSLEVGVDPSNERAITWYLRQGFRAIGASTLDVGPFSRPLSLFSLPLPR